ncbi:ATPase [bacterium (Candidatus Blackallbacteria) CG17_big_fil_post_rev_8_21_14_2_50_48_46]|uniref:ATPase n=1 Tax=bacterium (Candidatus Blackallbacteria) CG17_big_fil_post_rev_8_21_14_2_50_48_46 TaxID=2014261 RepID=A0A2M7G561_9BACT|nr:MAG: ATPase [bacterium (Candidatus Blackallbacteria) CG18_big_fil_WC_8_21_14_2_50_49_26]PIW17073.1 MAG: ATPase [bacterium (Candidatus Blackallbacteria) CG17_big_fil_post_rev_8_21_14_2_50_48_46]PIW47692.1 MAG: ATPase [bacterium (Candidatus Blackallbacteria) CG13_big_fil_rev_8_21_14_2_50_49_14]
MKHPDLSGLQDQLQQVTPYFEALRQQIHRVILGQENLVERLLIALLGDGHILLEGVPGLAKTLSISTLAQAVHVGFKRIQFTPDLLPADLIGTRIYNPQNNSFEVKQGPIFTHFLLADEINRAPAKVQSALLEAMQERQVTIGQETYFLPAPFLVLATQNPLEQEGTYPLPEAQLDRFMLKVQVNYPTPAQEKAIILQQVNQNEKLEVQPVLKAEDIVGARTLVRQIYLDPAIADYIVDLIFATREPERYQLDLQHLIRCGASPRASIYLALCAKVHAFLNKRAFVIPEDVKAIGLDVLRHRLSITYEAEAEEITSEQIVQKIFEKIQVP